MNELLQALKNTKAMEYIDGDGHTLWKPESLVAAGFPVALIKSITFTHVSDFDNPKYVIFGPDGMPVEMMEAVAALTLHYAVANELGLVGGQDYNDTFGGRGSHAREIAQAIKKYVEASNV